MNPLVGGFFERRQWYLGTDLEKKSSMRPVTAYETNYINASGYWMVMNESAISLRKEEIDDKKDEDALMANVWALVFFRYDLRVVGLRT